MSECEYFIYLHKGDSVIVQEGKVVASAWLDHKVVMSMSTNTQPGSMRTVHRRQKDESRQEVPYAQKPPSTTTNTCEVWTGEINSEATTGVE